MQLQKGGMGEGFVEKGGMGLNFVIKTQNKKFYFELRKISSNGNYEKKMS